MYIRYVGTKEERGERIVCMAWCIWFETIGFDTTRSYEKVGERGGKRGRIINMMMMKTKRSVTGLRICVVLIVCSII